MRNSFMKFSFSGLILLASLLFVSSGVMAQGLPNTTYAGGFNYDATVGTLDFNGLAFGTITYSDGTTMAIPYYSDPYNDPLSNLTYIETNGYLNLGTFQQDTGNQNLFHATSSSNLSISSVDYMGNPVDTYLTADLNSFEVINDAGGWHFNMSYDLNNITNLSYPGPNDSEFIEEFQANAVNGIANLSMSFTFTEAEGFTPGGVNTYGSADGIVAAPEPVSSILFLSGGAVLAARRFRKTRTNLIS